MKDDRKTKKQLISELEELRKRVEELERVKVEKKSREENPRGNEALRESEEKYRTLFETAPEAIAVIGIDGVVMDCNETAAEAAGITKEEIIGKPFWELGVIDTDDISGLRFQFENALKEKITQSYEIGVRNYRGEKRMLEVFTALWKKDGRIQAIQIILRDITERKSAENELKKTSDHLSLLLESLPVVTYTAKADGDYGALFISSNVTAVTGYKPEDFTSNSSFWTDNIHPDDVDEVFENLPELFEKGSKEHEYRFKIADGRYRWFCDILRVVRNPDGTANYLAGIWHDITERKIVEEKIMTYQKQLKSLASQLSLTEEKERRNIAAFLHDNIGQLLALSKLKLGELKKIASTPEYEELANEVQGLIEEAIREMRSLMQDLSPTVLYELGLEPAVEWLIEQFPRKHGITSHFEDDGENKPLDDNMRIILFQSVRELIINVVKHAKAENMHVDLKKYDTYIRINVKDDGVGFDSTLKDLFKHPDSGFGLFNINERLSQMGGFFEYESAPGRGTSSTLIAPLKAD